MKPPIKNAVIIIILLVGLVVINNLAQNPQNLRSRAIANAEMISPKADMKILGTTQVRAKAETRESIDYLQAVLKVDGQDVGTLEIQRIDEDNIGMSGPWQSGRHPVGQHHLEVVIVSTQTSPVRELTKVSIPITIVSP